MFKTATCYNYTIATGLIKSDITVRTSFIRSAVDMAEGIINEVQTEGRLSVRQMMIIAESRMTGLHPL